MRKVLRTGRLGSRLTAAAVESGKSLEEGRRMTRPLFSPSLICMNIARFEEQAAFLTKRAHSFHVDFMDGHFVPSLGYPPHFVFSLAPIATIPIDVHFMVEKPSVFLEETIRFGASMITLHPETIGADTFRSFTKIKDLGAKVGIALNPSTNVEVMKWYLEEVDKVTVMTVDPGFTGQRFIPSMLRKIEALRNERDRSGYSYLIEADGQCNKSTFRDLYAAGTDVFVVGFSGLFDLDKDIARAWDKMGALFREALACTSSSTEGKPGQRAGA